MFRATICCHEDPLGSSSLLATQPERRSDSPRLSENVASQTSAEGSAGGERLGRALLTWKARAVTGSVAGPACRFREAPVSHQAGSKRSPRALTGAIPSWGYLRAIYVAPWHSSSVVRV